MKCKFCEQELPEGAEKRDHRVIAGNAGGGQGRHGTDPLGRAAGRLLHGGQLRKTGRCPAPAPPHRGVACPGAETHIIKVRSGGPAAADPAGNGKAAPNKPELRFPA